MLDPSLWSLIGGGVGAAVGVVARTVWDSIFGWRSGVPIETWKIRASQLEKRLSEFYWPLFVRLQRDDVIWLKVYRDLREQPESSSWTSNLSQDLRRELGREIESKVILPNHLEATEIIRSKIHLANADSSFLDILATYVRHVDVFSAMRGAGIDRDPIAVGEPFPKNLSAHVKQRLDRFQREYEELLREKGILDLRDSMRAPMDTSRISQPGSVE